MAMLPLLMLAKPSLAAAPENDLISGATEVFDGYSDTLDTTEATTGDSDDESRLYESCWNNYGPIYASVWYKYSATSHAGVLVDASESNYAVGLLVGKGTEGNLEFMTCGDPTINFEVTAGTTYYVMATDINQDDDNGGELKISFEVVDAPVMSSFTVNKSGGVKNGVAKISGTYVCTGANSIWVDIDARQVVGRTQTIRGWGSSSATNTCDGNPQLWSTDIIPEAGKFAGGKLLTRSSCSGCNEILCSPQRYVEQTVQLSGGNKGSLRH